MNTPIRINVQDYIKRSDADETAGIQRALDVAMALVDPSDGYGPGIDVICPADNYRLSQPIRVYMPYVSLRGDGSTQTRFSRSTDYGDTIYFAPESLATAVYQAGNNVTGIGMFHSTTVPTNGSHIHHAACTKYELDDVTVSGHFGGVDCESSNALSISNFQSYADFSWWTALVAGSSLLRFRENSSVLGYKPPTEIFVTNFNAKGGNKATGAAFLDQALLIEGGDGIQFSNGHAGFANASAVIRPASSTVTVQSIFFNSIYLDGGSTGNTGLALINPNSGDIRAVKLTGGQVSNHGGVGIYADPGIDKSGLAAIGTTISENGSNGVQINSGSGRLIGCEIFNNAKTAAGAAQVCLSGAYDMALEGNFIGRRGTATPAVAGINFAGPNDRLIVKGNNFRGNSVDLANTINQGANSIVGDNTTAP